MGTGNDSTSSSEPFRRSAVIKRGRFAVQLHVPWENPGTVDLIKPRQRFQFDGIDFDAPHPWIVEIVLASFNQHHMDIFMVQVGQTACHNATVIPLASGAIFVSTLGNQPA